VAGMKRARVAMHKPGVYNAFEGVVGDVTAMEPAEADPRAVVAALEAALGKGIALVDGGVAAPAAAAAAAPAPAPAPAPPPALAPAPSPAPVPAPAVEAAVPAWEAAVAADGRVYWFLPSGESVWERPAGVAPWRPLADAEGRQYFWNTETGATSVRGGPASARKVDRSSPSLSLACVSACAVRASPRHGVRSRCTACDTSLTWAAGGAWGGRAWRTRGRGRRTAP
jgi:hypothetical protein